MTDSSLDTPPSEQGAAGLLSEGVLLLAGEAEQQQVLPLLLGTELLQVLASLGVQLYMKKKKVEGVGPIDNRPPTM